MEALTEVVPMSPVVCVRLKRTQLRSPEKKWYPQLRAKAAQTRHLAEFCLYLARLHVNGTRRRRSFRFRSTHRLHRQPTIDLPRTNVTCC